MVDAGRAGFVLAGGRSLRMGRDKALLRVGNETLIERTARLVFEAAGTVTLIAPPERYASLGLRAIPDEVENCGPLGGVLTALHATDADWNLIVACDMPDLAAPLFEDLFRAAESSAADAVVPQSSRGLDPLCAVYHRRSVHQAAAAIDRKILKMHDFISSLLVQPLPVSDPRPLTNINTPEQWSER